MQLIHQNGERLFVTSLDVANRFSRQHKNVIQSIENLDCSLEFNRLNFKPISYNDGKNRAQRAYEITRDGFVFLCMGFTGPQAALWKERYITAFNEMEAALRRQTNAIETSSAKFFHACNQELTRELDGLRQQMITQQGQLIEIFGRLDGARLGHLRAVGTLARVLDRERRVLVAGEKRQARETILALEREGVPRDIIAARTGRTLNHIRQVIFRARHEGTLPAQGELALEKAA